MLISLMRSAAAKNHSSLTQLHVRRGTNAWNRGPGGCGPGPNNFSGHPSGSSSRKVHALGWLNPRLSIPTLADGYRALRSLVDFQPENVRTCIVSHNVEVQLAANHFILSTSAVRMHSPSKLGPARTFPSGSTITLPPRISTLSAQGTS